MKAMMLRPAFSGTLCCLAVGWVAGCGGQSSEPSTAAADSTQSVEASASTAFLDSEESPLDATVADSSPAAAPSVADGNRYTSTGCLAGETACSNCLDDDGDGLMDAFDPECTGPLDDDEGTFATGIPGDNRDFCQDCFFDGNSGHGDDDCQYHTDCLYGETPSSAGASGCFSCEVSDTCRNTCQELTPNGCDCFGCCEIPIGNGETRHVLLSETCQLDLASDPSACESCVPSADCVNECDPCEICIGKPNVDPSCATLSEDPFPICPGDGQACTPEAPCPAGEYCLTGCCTEAFVIR